MRRNERRKQSAHRRKHPLRNATDLNVTGFVSCGGRFERLLFSEQCS